MRIFIICILTMLLGACTQARSGSSASQEESLGDAVAEAPAFDADSAYAYVKRMVDFGPRVPNTEAHRATGDWLTEKLREFGWEVTEQRADLKAFDGTVLRSRNIFAQLNPDKGDRTLLLAHWDSRPWADEDPDPQKRHMPVDGANDGASGVAVLLEIARQLGLQGSDAAVDILFADAEDWGEENNEESWAMGTRYFVQNPPLKGYRPRQAIVLDMVGSPDARFGYEYFSRESNPGLQQRVANVARRLGHGQYFHTGFGGAVTDDHIQLIEAGIPAIDIIDYRTGSGYQGFDPVWHTTSDNLSNISPRTLRAVGETILSVVQP